LQFVVSATETYKKAPDKTSISKIIKDYSQTILMSGYNEGGW